MTAISSADAITIAKAYLWADEVIGDSIVDGSLSSDGSGALTGREPASVVSESFGAIPVWHVSFPLISPEPGGEPHVLVAQDDTAFQSDAHAFIDGDGNRMALHHPPNPPGFATSQQALAYDTVVNAYYTQ